MMNIFRRFKKNLEKDYQLLIQTIRLMRIENAVYKYEKLKFEMNHQKIYASALIDEYQYDYGVVIRDDKRFTIR